MPGKMPGGARLYLVVVVIFWPKLGSSDSSGNQCQRLGKTNSPALEVDGDVVLGGLFPLHYVAPEPDHNFTEWAQEWLCSGFDLRAFRWVQTMVFAIEEINRNPILLPGVTLGYRILDSCDHVHTSLQSMFSLVSPSSDFQTTPVNRSHCLSSAQIPAVIGLASSTPTRAVAHTLGPFEIPMISYFATCTCLTDKRLYPSFLRTVPSDVFQVRALVQLISHFGWRWVGTIGTEDDYSRYGIQAFTELLEERGGCVEFHRTIPKVPTPAQIVGIADALEASTARVVVAFATEGQLLQLLYEVAHRNLTGKQWVASEAWVTANILTAPEFQHVLAGTLGFSFRGANISGLAEFLLRVRPSPKPDSLFVNMFWEEQFGCRLAYSDPKGSNRPLCMGLESLEHVESSYTSVTPVRVSYNVYKAVYAIAHALHNLLQCTPIGQNSNQRGCSTESQFTPGQLLQHLKKVNFVNQFGEKVYFDQNGEPVPLYDLINWQRDSRGGIRFQTVGSYDGSAPQRQQLEMGKVPIEWKGGHNQVPVSLCTSPCRPGTRQAIRPGQPVCCFDCLPCGEGEITNTSGATECIRCPLYYWSNAEHVACVAVIEEYISFQELMGIILVMLSLLGFAMATAISVIFFLFRATPVVKANNSELSFLLLLSLKLCFLCSLVFLGRPSLWSCQARQAAFGISFVLCISCILVKTIVVLLAFRSTLPGSTSLKHFGPPQQRAFIVSCTAGQVFLCLGWLALAPPYPFKNTEQGGKVVLECKDAWPLGFYLVLGYIGLLSCVCFVLAFLGRKLPDTFNEAKLITFSMLIFFAVWISFIPAYNSMPGKYTVAVEIFAILASAFGLLFCIFAPKCYIILLRPELNTKKGMTGKTLK